MKLVQAAMRMLLMLSVAMLQQDTSATEITGVKMLQEGKTSPALPLLTMVKQT